MIDKAQTLGEMVAANPAVARILHRHRFDYCCGGRQSLAEACAATGVDPTVVLREIDAAGAGTAEEVRWDQRSVNDVIQHILDDYHAPLRSEIPCLIDLAHRVEQMHADKASCPKGLAAFLSDMREAVQNHLGKEEGILFPLLLSGRGQMASMPIRVMLQEHDDHCRSLQVIRHLTNDLRTPEHACASWRELYRALAQLEVDLMNHMHLENHILFPRALAG